MMAGGSKPIFQVWMDALTKPNEGTFAEMAASPNAKAMTAYLWVFVGLLIEFILSSLVQGQQSEAMRRLLEQYGVGNGAGGGGGGGIGAIIGAALCGAPIGAVIGTVFFAIDVFIVQWIARMFGGKGTADQLAYALGAIAAPFSVILGVINLLSAIPFVGLCFGVVSFLASLYVLVLNIMAVKGVNQFGWGAAIGSLLIPALVIGIVCGCLFFAVFAALGPTIGNIFSSINQSLP
jgi:hypothetical protein